MAAYGVNSNKTSTFRALEAMASQPLVPHQFPKNKNYISNTNRQTQTRNSEMTVNRNASAVDSDGRVTFIPMLFTAQNACKNMKADDPFIGEEVLQEYCSLFAADGISNNIREDPYLAEIMDFSDKELRDIAQIQVRHQKEDDERREKQEIERQILKNKFDLETDKHLTQKGYFLKRTCPVKIPYKSSLTHEEHDIYLKVFLRLKEKPNMSVAEIPEYNSYLSLQNRVYEEQNQFMQFSHQVAKLELSSYNTVPDVINMYIDEYFQHRCKRAFKCKEHYTTEQQIPICPQDPEKQLNKLHFTHIGHVLSLGTLPVIKIPECAKRLTLRINDTISKMEHETQEKVQDKNLLNDTPVSVDRNAAYLAQQHRANIVISTSAMKVLADNHGPNFDKEWDIPVEVKSYLVTDPDGRQTQHRVVYIDKPMPKKIWTPLEKKQLYFKKSALVFFTQIIKKNIYKMSAPFASSAANESVGSRPVTEYDDDLFGPCISGTEVFGDESFKRTKGATNSKIKLDNKRMNESPGSTQKHIKADKLEVLEDRMQKDKRNSNCSSQKSSLNDVFPRVGGTDHNEHVTRPVPAFFESEKSFVDNCSSGRDPIVNTENNIKQKTFKNSSKDFLDNLLNMQTSMLKHSHTQSNEIEDQNDETIMSSKIPQLPWTNGLSTDWENFSESHLCPNWTGKNVHYQLFSLGPDTSHSTSSLGPIRVLVRSNLHGITYNKNEGKTYVAHPKIENKPYFGAEVSTLSEVTQQWVQLLVRPSTSLFHVRVCQDTGEILMTEVKDLAEILKDGKQLHVGFSPQKSLETLYSIFSATLGHPTGHYLLHHTKTEAFVQLMKAIHPNKETSVLNIYNLHKAYEAASVSTRLYTAPPWLALDTHVLTPFHKKHKKIPGTFPMKNPTKNKGKKEVKKKKANAKLKKSLHDLKDEN